MLANHEKEGDALADYANALAATILLTPRETARRLGVSEKTLERDRTTSAYGLPYVKLGHKTVRYRAVDVEALIVRRMRTSTSEEVAA